MIKTYICLFHVHAVAYIHAVAVYTCSYFVMTWLTQHDITQLQLTMHEHVPLL